VSVGRADACGFARMMSWLRSWIAYNLTGHAAPVAQAPAPMTAWGRYGQILRNILIASVTASLLGGAGWYFLAHRHYDWAVVVVAGDWRAHDGSPTEGFDNARRDVSAALTAIGFRAEDMAQFSVRPERYPADHVLAADRRMIGTTLDALASHAPGGCLLYFSSHGTPQGMVLNGTILGPDELAHAVDAICGDRPTVVIISACFSGVFVPALQGRNRMVITAARADRTSFGCSQDDKYPYFDTCMIANLQSAHGFPQLADRVRDCVAKREYYTGVSPPSEPQVSIGADVAAALPKW
jgi:hypothetical protein